MAQSSRRRADAHESAQPSDFPSNRSTIERQQSPRHLIGSSVSSFQHARIEGDVSNNRVYTAGRDLIVNDNDLVTMILLPHVASGAIFDSDERYSAGRCHPGTRQRMIDQVKEWLQGTSPDSKRTLWMYGPAGAGKSSIMQSICEFLRDSDSETSRASFFVSRGHPDCGKGNKLFVTLAYQLAMQFPSLRTEINNALYRDATLPTKSMDKQFRSLIIDPLRRCETIPSHTPILFIDGLDECDADDNQGVDSQSQIIALISQSMVADNIPVRFMIASRPEYWIREPFETSPLSDITLRLSLRDDFSADSDIRRLLTERFEQIRLKKSRVMQSVGLLWPPEYIVKRFVEEASGQYIYASTILKFVGDHPFKSPVEQLRIITTPGPQRATAYSELDRLYATIVSAYPEWETMKRVLSGLLIDVNLAAIQVFLEVPRSEITLVLDALCSLIDVVPPTPLSEDDQLLISIFGPSFEDEKISFCHLSFREFLLDEARSGSYHIDVDTVRSKVVSGFVDIIQRNLDENYELEPHISYNVGLLEYRRMMVMIIRMVPSHFDDFQNLFPRLHCMMETFRRFDPRRSMNHPACFVRDMDLLSVFLENLNHKFKRSSFPLRPSKYDPYAVERDPLLKVSLAIVRQLKKRTSMGRKTGIHLLSLCKGFSMTHTLFLLWYLGPLRPSKSDISGVEIRHLLNIPGNTVNDTLSSILQHRHIINVAIDIRLCMSLVNLGETSALAERRVVDRRFIRPIWTNDSAVNVDLKQKIGGGWLCRTEWTNQCTSLVCESLRSVQNNRYSDWADLLVHDVELSYINNSILLGFFDNHTVSDIHGEDYFRNKYHLSLLEVMVDLKAWLALLSSRPYLRPECGAVIVPVLRWFNRQLANPTTTKLIDDHDASLLSIMTMTRNTIFQKCLVPLFTTPYFGRLSMTWDSNSVELKVSSSSYSEEKIDPFPVEHNDVATIRNLHNEMFGEEPPHAGDDQSVIPRSEWYPYFAAYLLNICVKYRYFRNGTASNGNSHTFEFHEFFPLIVQCLPYAETTSQNLDALRAIKYLSKEADVRLSMQQDWSSPLRRFHPPSGFCSGAREFLKRYESSVLSSGELSDFELWLEGVKEDPKFI